MTPFECTTYGKWILSGEHTVLRNGGALAFPVRSKYFNLKYESQTQSNLESHASSFLELKLMGECGEDYKLIFWAVFENALQKIGKSKKEIQGTVFIDSNLPVGAGLGASAAICVAIGRWFSHLGYISRNELNEFSRSLEDLFHGESSGVDIAVAVADQGIYFKKGQPFEPINILWQPHWYLSYSGQIGVTAECVKKVKNFIIKSPEKAQELDEKMKEATFLAKKALLTKEKTKALENLIEAIDMANEVFQSWDLTDGPLSYHMDQLKDKGALAVKPTGSGGGGYVLSLWDKTPDQSLDLIEIS